MSLTQACRQHLKTRLNSLFLWTGFEILANETHLTNLSLNQYTHKVLTDNSLGLVDFFVN